jgi:multisubunit Na+/H+ antiporter MnhG subunit
MTKLITALLTAVATANLNIGVISDSHFNTLYNAYNSGSKCTTTGSSGEVVALVGRYGCDPSEVLIDFMY